MPRDPCSGAGKGREEARKAGVLIPARRSPGGGRPFTTTTIAFSSALLLLELPELRVHDAFAMRDGVDSRHVHS